MKSGYYHRTTAEFSGQKQTALLQQEHLKKAEKSSSKPRVANKNPLIPRANHPMQLTTLKRCGF